MARKKNGAAEAWKPIPGLENYEASSLGRIRSLDRVRPFHGRYGLQHRRHKGRVLAPRPSKSNHGGGIYHRVQTDGGAEYQINRLVCAAFHGPAPTPKHEAAHRDGDSENNKPGNLVWATPAENAAHKIGHGTAPCGSKNGYSKLRESSIRPIFKLYISGVSAADIAEKHNVARSVIARILRGEIWKHVKVGGDLRRRADARRRINLERSWDAAAARREALGPSLGAA